MGSSRILRIAFFTACLLAGLVAVFNFFHHSPPDAAARERNKLDASAEHRQQHDRGLSPCGREDRELVDSAWSFLRRVGEPVPEVVALTAPTFSEITVTAFRPNSVQTYKLTGHTGFGPPSSEWFSSKPQPVAFMNMDPESYAVVASSLSRHIRFPMTAHEYGRDGVRYYFGIGDEGCATAWTPQGGGPADLITRMLSASEGADSTAELVALARSIEAADRAR